MIDPDLLELKEMSVQQFPRTLETLNLGLKDSVAPGFVTGLWEKKNPDTFWVTAVGHRRVIPSPLPMKPDTIFDFASVTKIFATAALSAALVDRGWLRWDDSVAAFFPGYAYPEIRIHNLLSHSAGFAAWRPLWETLRDWAAPLPLHRVSIKKRQRKTRNLILETAPEAKPGETVLYSDISFLLLGFILEEITRMPLHRAVAKFVWEPLAIREAYFHPVHHSASEDRRDDVAATEDSEWRGGILQGQVHDDNCWAMGGYAGHAGAFGTVKDLLQFARGLLLNRLLSPGVLRASWTRLSVPTGNSRTLGWDTPSGDAPSAGRLFSSNSVGHLGYTGTSLWIDPKAELAVALLSNRVHPSRENIKIRAFRPKFHDALRTDLGR